MTEPDDYNDDDECQVCDGEGYTYSCFDGQCLDSDVGCEDCLRRCPRCNPPRPLPVTEELRQVLAEALAKATPQDFK